MAPPTAVRPAVAPAPAPAARKDPFGFGLGAPARAPAPAPAPVPAPVQRDDDWSDVDFGQSAQPGAAPSLELDPPAQPASIELPDDDADGAPELAPLHAFVPPPAATGHQPQAAALADGGEATLREALSQASREVIERVVWEVVPQLAETIIRENLDRLVKSRQG
jgi:hypothetical protein